jgi:hypothetical protein
MKTKLLSLVVTLAFFGVVSPVYSASCSVECGFLYSDGTYTTLSVPGSTQTAAYGINNKGQIVGGYETATGEYGFL